MWKQSKKNIRIVMSKSVHIIIMLLYRLRDKLSDSMTLFLIFMGTWVFSIFSLYVSSLYDGMSLSVVYDALKLFGLNGDQLLTLKWGSGGACDRFAIFSMWLAPVVTVLTLVALLINRMILPLSGWFLPNCDHLVLCGLGSWGINFIEGSNKVGEGINKSAFSEKIVIIEKDPSSPLIEEAIKAGHHVIIGDCKEKSILEKANASKAKKIFLMLPCDADNIEASHLIQEYIKCESASSPVIMPHLDDIRLSVAVTHHTKFNDTNDDVELRFFNAMQLGVINHLEHFPPEEYADTFNQKNVHFALYGTDDFVINFIYIIAHLAHYKNWESCTYKYEEGDAQSTNIKSKRVEITLFNQSNEKIRSDLEKMFPNLDKCLDITYRRWDINSSSPYQHSDGETFTQHIFCFSDESLSIRSAMNLRRVQLETCQPNVPIFVRTMSSKGVARLIESNVSVKEVPDNIYPIGELSKAFAREELYLNHFDDLSKKIHGNGWKKASSDFRFSSFMHAYFLPIRLRAIGFSITQTNTEQSKENITWTDNEKWILAHLEHSRYKAERWMTGWSWSEDEDRSISDIGRTHGELEAVYENKLWLPKGKDGAMRDYHDYPAVAKVKNHLDKSGLVLQKVRVGSFQKNSKSECEADKRCDVLFFNLYNSCERIGVKEILKGKAPPKIVGLLPIPFDIYAKMACEDEKKCIMELTGGIDRYIEMPFLGSIYDWKKDTGEANKQMLSDAMSEVEKYIELRTGECHKEGDGVIGRFLPRPRVNTIP